MSKNSATYSAWRQNNVVRRLAIILWFALISNPVALATAATSKEVKAAPSPASATYVGSARCQQCHSKQYQDWLKSDHFKAMQLANDESVLGDFQKTVNFHGIESRLYKEDEKFWIETLAKDGKRKKYHLPYTFGHYPLQQYLADLGDGHFHALNIAWDSRAKSEGGQRWYHLQPTEEITPQDPFFWQAHFQNWNGRCAECHTTNYQKNYDAKTHSYNSTWSEINVACEACHGPASQHLLFAQTGKLGGEDKGFKNALAKPLSWQFEKESPIAKAIGNNSDQYLDMCGGCHSRRSPLKALQANENYHDNFRLSLLNDNLYFADGQIQDEVFVMGSFLQSKMHAEGVTCNNCHNPHSGEVFTQTNDLCSQCHAQAKYDEPSHHHHAKNSTGSQCVNCHMPARTYMGVDDRRDHSFTIPNPNTSIATGAPNACTDCHAEKDNKWARDQLKSWGKNRATSHWAMVNHQARAMDRLATQSLINVINKNEQPPIIQASLIYQLGALPSQEAILTAQQNLFSNEPLVRRAAISNFMSAPPQIRWQTLAPLLNDDNRAVRFEVLIALLDLRPQMPAEVRESLASQIDEYRESLMLTEDFPSTQVSLAMLEANLGNFQMAEKAYLQALKIEPTHFPAMLNLAELYRNQGKAKEEEGMLKSALTTMPDSGTVQHSYGLLKIRQQNYEGALPYLEAALGKLDSQPRFAYIYAVALDNLGNTQQAIKVLNKANEDWPNQVDILSLLIMYYEKTNQQSLIAGPLNALKLLAPQSPQVQQWMQKYR